MKKAFRWLEAQQLSYDFVDYKKTPPPEQWLTTQIQAHGVDVIVNKRGMTYRKLDEATKASLDATNAVPLLLAQPSMIKRPILCIDTASTVADSTATASIVGFTPDSYAEFCKNHSL